MEKKTIIDGKEVVAWITRGGKHIPIFDKEDNGKKENETAVYRAGELDDVRGTGIFFTTDPEVAKIYERTGAGGKTVEEYYIPNDLNLKTATNRWKLLRELNPDWNYNKTYDRFITEGFRKGDRQTGLFEGLTAEQRLQTYVEKKIKGLLSKQGYDGVKYLGNDGTDQSGEYQIFNVKKIRRR